jgi:hypothetical protein
VLDGKGTTKGRVSRDKEKFTWAEYLHYSQEHSYRNNIGQLISDRPAVLVTGRTASSASIGTASLLQLRVDDATGLLVNPVNATIHRRKRVGSIAFAILQRLGRSLAMQ